MITQYLKYLNIQQALSGQAALLALLAGAMCFALVYVVLHAPKSKPRSAKIGQRGQQFEGIQVRLDKAQINISAEQYVKQSLIYGITVGLAMWLLVGAISLSVIGVIGGFLFTWTQLEQKRDKEQVAYSRRLAGVCDTIRNSYGVNPSLKKALESVAEYSESPIREDFMEILVSANQERLAMGLQTIADKRRSIVFDSVATSLIRASEATGEVGEMLSKLADATRSNVAAFEDTLVMQVNARSLVQWGTFGPWLIFTVFKVMAAGMTFRGFAALGGYFDTVEGNIVAILAALLTLWSYRYCMRLASRGLVVRRVATSDSIAFDGTQTTTPSPTAGRHPLSAQGRPQHVA